MHDITIWISKIRIGNQEGAKTTTYDWRPGFAVRYEYVDKEGNKEIITRKNALSNALIHGVEEDAAIKAQTSNLLRNEITKTILEINNESDADSITEEELVELLIERNRRIQNYVNSAEEDAEKENRRREIKETQEFRQLRKTS